jgi:hypothetical protein
VSFAFAFLHGLCVFLGVGLTFCCSRPVLFKCDVRPRSDDVVGMLGIMEES